MLTKTKKGKVINIRQLTVDDFEKLSKYLYGLSDETKHRFGPHEYSVEAIKETFCDKLNIAYIVQEANKEKIIAYCIIKIGFLKHDRSRLESYGLSLNNLSDCTFAPSVADDWQSEGIGNAILNYTIENIKQFGIKRIILWGGVQISNKRAVNFYKKNGFKTLGEFEYNGMNLDMMLEI